MIRQALAFACLAAVVSCRESPAPAARTQGRSDRAWPAGLGLRLDPLHAEFVDSEPVLVEVLFENGGDSITVHLDPTALHLVVLDSTGRRVPPTESAEPPSLGGTALRFVSRGGLTGQVFDLRCLTWGESRTGACSERHVLTPGTYRVIGEYVAIPPPGLAARPAIADTAAIRIVSH